jgi:hypothetical protein
MKSTGLFGFGKPGIVVVKGNNDARTFDPGHRAVKCAGEGTRKIHAALAVAVCTFLPPPACRCGCAAQCAEAAFPAR